MTFEDFARANGLNPSHFLADGQIHRCRTFEKPRKANGSYRWDGSWGWVQDWGQHVEPIVWRDAQDAVIAPRKFTAAPVVDQRERREAASRAAVRAAQIVAACRWETHPYLIRKGFREEKALVCEDGRMVLPMRNQHNTKVIQTIQYIDLEGTKKFLYQGDPKGAIFPIGAPGSETWLCEGYATGLSIALALKKLYRRGQVLVCFTAGNLKHVTPLVRGPRFIVADNDHPNPQTGKNTGLEAAIATGVPYVLVPEVGKDANDWHLDHGLFALTSLMQKAYGSPNESAEDLDAIFAVHPP